MIKHILITFLSLALFQGSTLELVEPNQPHHKWQEDPIIGNEPNQPKSRWQDAPIVSEVPTPPVGFTEDVTGKQDKKPVTKTPAGEVDLGPVAGQTAAFGERDVILTPAPAETLPQTIWQIIWQTATVFLILILAICLVQFLIYKYLLKKILRLIRHLWKIKKLTILWMGILLIVLMGLFPPHIISNSYRHEGEIQYMFLVNTTRFKIDISRLFVQWVIVAVITGGLLLTFRSKKD